MLLVIGPLGGLNWEKTSKHFKDNYTTLAQNGWLVGIPGMGAKSFDSEGGKQWFSFRCIDCTRVLPIDCSDLDHISPRSGLNWRIDPSIPASSHFGSRTVGWHSQAPFSTWAIGLQGQVGVIKEGSIVIVVHDYRVPAKQDCILVSKTPAAGGFTRAAAGNLDSKVRELSGIAAAAGGPAPTHQEVARLHPPALPPKLSPYSFHPGKFPKPTQAGSDEWRFEIQTVLENNLENLMLLCSHCNRSKSDSLFRRPGT